MTELLQQVITELKKLPPDQQDAIASRLMAELKEKQLAELRPITNNKPLRPFGLCAGEFTVPEDFDAPLPEDILSAFEGQ
ncbi:prevent-host-death protein [Crocosphaera sp. UHCC 0190]|uniref:prevent-host-death protein n=1 Tax=Crocosphaera sp. UHCC 0190 TaxID=3110246 RepID=UPI002B21C700|nr:prevent-host-death protein [Crocosphaera sp. UHCC 0190]MEA5508956.1 prevent-host-death protein [Crocosphaera sp. UHCC 0190]